MIDQLLFIGFGGVFALIICINALKIGTVLKVLDVPDPVGGRKRHDSATPLIGGMAILLPSLLVGYLSVGAISFPTHHTQHDIKTILSLSFAMFVIGLIDDRWMLSAKIRLVVSVIGAVVAVLRVADLDLSMISLRNMADPFFLDGFATLMSVLCLVSLLNAVNMADGKNGLVIGCCSFWTAFLLYYAPDFLRPLLT